MLEQAVVGGEPVGDPLPPARVEAGEQDAGWRAGAVEADAAAFAAVAEAGHPQDAVLWVVVLLAGQAGEEELGPVVNDVRLVEQTKSELVFLRTHLDDAKGVLGEAADLAAGEEDSGLQLRLLRVTGRGDGERLVGVRE
ncbi:hypothetical protein ABZY34_05105 [Streptomyces virginiae]|uniref:hypothetical protein n=1 Tax=Streptomyces virginiae TaxID=1961 RepID=UPI00339F3933